MKRWATWGHWRFLRCWRHAALADRPRAAREQGSTQQKSPRTRQWTAVSGCVGRRSQVVLIQTPFLALPGQSHFCLVPQFPFQHPFFQCRPYYPPKYTFLERQTLSTCEYPWLPIASTIQSGLVRHCNASLSVIHHPNHLIRPPDLYSAPFTGASSPSIWQMTGTLRDRFQCHFP